VALVEEVPLLDNLKHAETTWLEKGNWAKMTFAGTACSDSESGASFSSFGTTSGSFWSLKEFTGNQAVSFVRSLGGDISERFWSLWMCFANATHNGYRAQFIDQTTVTEGKVKIFKVVGGVETLLIESAGFTLEAGDRFGFQKIGTTLSAWRQAKGTGAWTKLTEVVNAEFTKGNVGLDGSGSDPNFTEFAAGVEGTRNFTASFSGTSGGSGLLHAPHLVSPAFSGASGMSVSNIFTTSVKVERPSPTVTVRSRVDPRKLALAITGSTGAVHRWGADEAEAENVPMGLNFTTQIPGGFGTLNCSLNRRPDLSYSDLQMFAPVRLYGGGGWVTAFDGYLSSTPSDRSTSYTISPQVVGWSASMKDDNSFQMIYVDRDLTKWHSESASYKITLINGGYKPEGFSSAPDTANGLPSLMLQISDTNAAGNRPLALAEYDAGAGNLVGSIYRSWTATVADGSAGGWNFETRSNATDSGATGEEIHMAGASGAALWTPGVARRYIQFLYWAQNFEAGGLTGSGKTYIGRAENVAVYGPHGLTRQGTEPGGFHGHQIIEDIIKRAAPKLTANGIWQDSFIIPQMAFATPTTADAAVAEVNTYYFFDSGVYENRNFFWRPPGTGRQWNLRVKDGVTPTDQGNKIETAFNGVIVQYTDVAGVQQTVGPPGSGAPVTSTALQDLSSSNPCNAFGRKRWALLQMSSVTTSVGAVETGKIFLEVNNNRPTAGTATVTGWATDSNGNEWPSWMIRGGDTIVFTDASNPTPHYVLSTSYDHESLTLTAALDAPPNRLEWLLNRLQVVIAPLGIG